MHGMMNFILLFLLTCMVGGQQRNPCKSNPDDEPCANNGKCIIVSENEFKCECSSDFEGEFCQFKNLCKYSPCQNGGSCRTFEDTVSCSCPLAYRGIHCEELRRNIKLPPTPKPKSRTTSTPKLTNGRTVTAIAASKPVSLMRSLNNPRAWKNPHADCNSTHPCQNSGVCNDFMCNCTGTGYRGPSCSLVDECYEFNCNLHGDCILEKDSDGIIQPKCNCDFGFIGDACENKTVQHPCEIDFSNGCRNAGVCHNTTSSEAECICTKDFIGSICQYQNPCKGFACAHGESKEPIGFTNCGCICSSSYTGDHCEHANPCQASPCLHGGICVSQADGTFYCDCKIGFLDPFCQDRDPCLLGGNNMCLNGATCQRIDDFEFICRCRLPFQEEHCETLNLCNIDPGECIDDISTKVGNCYPCKNNATCIRMAKDVYDCICPPDTWGPKCENLGDEENEHFESPTHLNILQKGKFYMEIAHINLTYDYEWHLDKGGAERNIKRVTANMLRAFPDGSPQSVFRKIHTIEHSYIEAGVYPIQVIRTNHITGERKVVWTNRIIVDDMNSKSCFGESELMNVGRFSNFSDAPTYRRYRPILITAAIYVNCTTLAHVRVTSHSYNHSWFLQHSSSAMGNFADVTEKYSEYNLTEKFVRISPFLLKYGYYLIRLEVKTTFTIGGSIEDTSIRIIQGYFKVRSTQPYAAIRGGSSRAYGVSDKIMDASDSFDRDFPNLSPKLKYEWSCQFVKSTTIINNDCGIKLNPEQQPALDSSVLTPGMTYRFKVKVTSLENDWEGKPNYATTIQDIHKGYATKYSIECIANCNEISPSDKVVLKCTCHFCSAGLAQEWENDITGVFPASKERILQPSSLIRLNNTDRSGSQNIKDVKPLGSTTSVYVRIIPSDIDPTSGEMVFTCKAKGDDESIQISIPIAKTKKVTSTGKECHIFEEPTFAAVSVQKYGIKCDDFNTGEYGKYDYLFYDLYAKASPDSVLSFYPHEYGFLIYHTIHNEVRNIYLPSGDPLIMNLVVTFPSVDGGYQVVLNFKKIINSFKISTWGHFNGMILPGVSPQTKRQFQSDLNMTIKAGDYERSLQLMFAVTHEISLFDPEKWNVRDDKTHKLMKLRMIQTLAEIPHNSFKQTEHIGNVLYALVEHSVSVFKTSAFHWAVPLYSYNANKLLQAVKSSKDVFFERDVDFMSRAALEVGSTLINHFSINCLLLRDYWDAQTLEASISTQDLGFDNNVDRDYFLEEDDDDHYLEDSHDHIDTDHAFLRDFVDDLRVLHRHGLGDVKTDEYPDVYVLLQQLSHYSRNATDVLLIVLKARTELMTFGDPPFDFLPYVEENPSILVYAEILPFNAIPQAIFPDAIEYRNNDISLRNKLIFSPEQMAYAKSHSPELAQLHYVLVRPNIHYDDFSQDFATGAAIIRLRDNDLNTNFNLKSEETKVSEPHTLVLQVTEVTDIFENLNDKLPLERFTLLHIDSIDPEEIEAVHIQVPPNSIFYVAVEFSEDLIYNDFQLMVSVTKKYLPRRINYVPASCGGHVLPSESSDGTLSFHKVFKTEALANTAGNKTQMNRLPLEDYYVSFWPTKRSVHLINASISTVKYGISRPRCISKQAMNDKWTEEGCSLEADSGSPDILTCKCSHFSYITTSYVTAKRKIKKFQRLSFDLTIVPSLIIPLVVIISVIVYLLLLVLTCYCTLKNKKHRPRLIVSVDINKFDEESFYLLTVQTGNKFNAGTSANIACRLYGSQGRSKVYVLRDYKLDTTVRDSEANFLISSVKHLGNMEKIRIWHDNIGYSPSWYCLKIIVRDVKTEKYWNFFIRRWLSITSDDTSIVAEATAATRKENRDYYKEFTNWSHLWQQTKKYHIWISPFLGSSKWGVTVPERLTVAMTLLCCHFFFLILFYGTPTSLNSGFVFQWGLFEFNLYIVCQSLKVAPLTITIGYLLTHLIRSLHGKRIPTLLVWRNKPDMRPYKEWQQMLNDEAIERRKNIFIQQIHLHGQQNNDSKSLHQPYLESEQSLSAEVPSFHNTKQEEVWSSSEEEYDDDEEGWDKLDPNRIMVVGVPKEVSPVNLLSESNYYVEEIPSSSTSSNEVFRIPSTDMLETRNWISETLNDSQATIDLEPGDLVHTIHRGKPFSGPDQIVELGMVGGVTSVKDDHPESFVYRTNSTDSIEHLIEEDVRKSYVRPENPIPANYQPRKIINTKIPTGIKATKVPVSTSDMNVQTDPILRKRRVRHHVLPVKESEPFDQSFVNKEEFYDDQRILNTKQVYLELCEMPIQGRREETIIWIAWLLCIFIIILTCFLTIYFGRWYGRLRSLNWCASLGWALLQSFLIFQPLKILLVGYIMLRHIEKGKRLPIPVKHNRERFQLYRVNGLTVLPKIYPLYYQLFFPEILFKPIIASQIFAWKMESRRKRILRKGLRDMIVFLIFLIVLNILAYAQRGDHLYNTVKNLEDSFLLRRPQLPRSRFSYKQIKDVDGYYNYLEKVLIKEMYNERDINGRILLVQPTDAKIWMKDKVSILIGIPRIRQLRIVENNPEDEEKGIRGTCQLRYRLKEGYPYAKTSFSCNADFWDGYYYSNKDTKDYLLGWKPVPKGQKRVPVPSLTNDIWKFHTAEETQSVDKLGFISWYDGSGYIAELGRVEANSLGVIKYMKDTKWIDERTRALFIEFSSYNPHVNVFNTVVLLTERTAALNWLSSSSVLASEFLISQSFTTLEAILLTIYILCSIYFFITSVYCLVLSFKMMKMATFRNLWLWIDLLIPVLSIAILSLYWVNGKAIMGKLEEISRAHPNAYIDLQHTMAKRYTQTYVICTIMVLSMFKLWHLLVISSRSFFVIGFAFSITASYSMGFLFIFLILHLAFASFNFIAFGTRHYHCVTIGSAILNSLYLSRFPKEAGFDNLKTFDEQLGPIYFFAYNFIIYIFIMNVFISIYTLGLQEAKETALQRPFSASYGNYIWIKLQSILPSSLRKKLVQKAHIPPGRLNAMRQVAINTLRAALQNPSPEEQRMREMKAVATEFLKGAGLSLISKHQKLMLKQKKIELIEEDRLNKMRELTVSYIREKQNIEFCVEELKKYEDFDYEILKIQIDKLQRKVQIVDDLLNEILQRL